MKKEAVTIQNAAAVVFPIDFARKCLAIDTCDHFLGFDSKKYADRFYFKNSLNNEFLTDEQLKALSIQIKTVSKKVTKKTAKTENKEVTEERIMSNDILKDCLTYTDCYNVILKALRRTEVTDYNMSAPLISQLEIFNSKVEKTLKAMINDCSIFHSPVKNQRAIFTVQEIFTADDELESATPQILAKELNTMF